MKGRGCEWEGRLEDLQAHLDVDANDCQHVDVVCSNKCGQSVPRLLVPSHLTDSCPNRDFFCHHCNFTATYHVVRYDHWPECPRIPVPCPNGCSVGAVERADMEDHVKVCLLQEVACGLSRAGCRERFLLQDEDRHMEDNTQRHLLLMAATSQRMGAEFEEKLQEQRAETVRVKQALEEKERKIVQVEQTLEEKGREIQALREEKGREIQALKEEKGREIQALEEKGREIQAFGEEKGREIQALREEKDREIQALREEKGREIQALEEKGTEIQAFGEAKGREIQALREEKDREIQALGEEKGREIQVFGEEMGREIQALREEKDREIKALKEKGREIQAFGEAKGREIRALREEKGREIQALGEAKGREIQALREEKDKQVGEIQEEVASLVWQLQFLGGRLQLHHVPYRSTPPVCFTLDNFSKLKAGGKTWTSPDVYTHEQGYKIHVTVIPDFRGDFFFGDGVGMHVYAKPGEYDARLKWPARASFTIQLLNQHRDHAHITRENPVKEWGKPTGDKGIIVWRPFIGHADLAWNSGKQTQYLKNDCLVFRLTNVELK